MAVIVRSTRKLGRLYDYQVKEMIYKSEDVE